MSKYIVLKNIVDKIIAIILITISIPLMIIIAILIKLDSKGKTIFKHKRLGKNGKIIYVYKFRTMKKDAEKMIKNFTPEQRKEFNENFKLKNDPRITKIGKKLRRLSLDEIPQLINVLKGDLALVGPRPIIEEEIKKYGKDKEKFLSIKPGVVGEWTANGRSNIDYETRKKLELKYIDNVNLKNDVKIIYKTIVAVIKREGAI